MRNVESILSGKLLIRVSGPPITYSACVTKNGTVPNYYLINSFLL